MVINPLGAERFWNRNVWIPPNYEAENNEIERLSDLAHKYLLERKGPSIIELCCGKGDFSIQLLRRINGYSTYHFVDTNSDSLERLSQKLAEEGLLDDRIKILNHYVGKGDLDQVLEQKYDFILCARAITHIPNIPNYFSEISDQLNPEGVFVGDIVPDSERMPLLREKHGLKSYAIEVAYKLGIALAKRGIGSRPLTSFGLLRTINPSIEQISTYLATAKLELVEGKLDSENHFYRFVSKKI